MRTFASLGFSQRGSGGKTTPNPIGKENWTRVDPNHHDLLPQCGNHFEIAMRASLVNWSLPKLSATCAASGALQNCPPVTGCPGAQERGLQLPPVVPAMPLGLPGPSQQWFASSGEIFKFQLKLVFGPLVPCWGNADHFWRKLPPTPPPTPPPPPPNTLSIIRVGLTPWNQRVRRLVQPTGPSKEAMLQ